MPDDLKKLDNFIQSIMGDAKSESESILFAVETERREAMDEAKKEFAAEADRYYQSELARARAESGRAVSEKLLDNKRALYRYRQQREDELTEDVRERLIAFTGTPDYAERLRKMLGDAIARFEGAPTAVYLRPGDMPHAERLRQAFPGVELSFAEGSFALGGLICECEALRLRADQSFDARLEDVVGKYAELLE